MKKRHSIGTWVRSHRLKTVLTVGIVAIGLLGVYVGASLWAWSQYQTATAQSQASNRVKLDALFALPLKTADDRTKWLGSAQSVLQEVTKANSCDISNLYAWQTIVPSYKAATALCASNQQKIRSLTAQLSILIESVRVEQQFAAIIAEPLKTTKVGENDYAGQVSAWQNATDALTKVQVPSNLTNLKESAVKTTRALTLAWGQLADAQSAQNAADYKAASIALAAAYGGLQGVGAESVKAFQTLADTLQSAYNQAFSS